MLICKQIKENYIIKEDLNLKKNSTFVSMIIEKQFVIQSNHIQKINRIDKITKH